MPFRRQHDRGQQPQADGDAVLLFGFCQPQQCTQQVSIERICAIPRSATVHRRRSRRRTDHPVPPAGFAEPMAAARAAASVPMPPASSSSRTRQRRRNQPSRATRATRKTRSTVPDSSSTYPSRSAMPPRAVSEPAYRNVFSRLPWGGVKSIASDKQRRETWSLLGPRGLRLTSIAEPPGSGHWLI